MVNNKKMSKINNFSVKSVETDFVGTVSSHVITKSSIIIAK